MKKVLSILLIMILALGLAACGGGSNNTTATATATAAATTKPSQAAPAETDEEDYEDEDYSDEDLESDDDEAGGSEDYEEVINAYINSFNQLMSEDFTDLMNAVDYLETEEDLLAWCETFIEMKEAIGQAADELASVADYVPEEYQESHVLITIATAAVYDSMTGFEYAVDAAIAGDEDEFMDGLSEFIGNIAAAEALWDEATE